MSTDRWERLAPLTGILAVVLWVAGVLTIAVAGDSPADDAPASELAEFFENESGAILTGAMLFGLGCAAFLWFVGSLRVTLREAEGSSGRLSAVAFGSGAVVVALSMLAMAPFMAGVAASEWLDRGGVSEEAAETLWLLQNGIFFFMFLAAVPLFLATGLVSLRTGVLSRWYGWITVVLGLALIVPWISWIVFLLGLPLWVLATSGLLFWRGRTPSAA